MRRFVCSVCGYEMDASKRRGKRTKEGHIKHMYCPVCMEVTEHRQIGEWEEYKLEGAGNIGIAQ